MAADVFGDHTIVGNDKSCAAVTGCPLGFASGRALPAIGDDHQHLAGSTGGHGIQGGLQGVSAGAEDVGDVDGENIGAEVKSRGHDGGALLFRVRRGGAGEHDAVDEGPVTPSEDSRNRRQRPW